MLILYESKRTALFNIDIEGVPGNVGPQSTLHRQDAYVLRDFAVLWKVDSDSDNFPAIGYNSGDQIVIADYCSLSGVSY